MVEHWNNYGDLFSSIFSCVALNISLSLSILWFSFSDKWDNSISTSHISQDKVIIWIWWKPSTPGNLNMAVRWMSCASCVHFFCGSSWCFMVFFLFVSNNVTSTLRKCQLCLISIYLIFLFHNHWWFVTSWKFSVVCIIKTEWSWKHLTLRLLELFCDSSLW